VVSGIVTERGAPDGGQESRSLSLGGAGPTRASLERWRPAQPQPQRETALRHLDFELEESKFLVGGTQSGHFVMTASGN
jgi:hypothetical protein